MKIFVFLLALASASADYYDKATGQQISGSEFQKKLNISEICVTKVDPCEEGEFRRVDGTCYNLLHPSYGATYTPWRRLLPPYKYKAIEPRETQDGRPLPLSRVASTTLLSKGRVPNAHFTNLITQYLLLIVGDVALPFDTANYVKFKPYCCEPEGKEDDLCVPAIIPPDDPVHRFSNIRCQNLTKPESFQTKGCLAKNTPFLRGTDGTPSIDLSGIYGSDLKQLNKKGRMFTGGLLKYEVLNGNEWPPFMAEDDPRKDMICLANVGEEKKVCFDAPDLGMNAIVGALPIMYYRQHNRLARELENLNPCWDDEMLFYKAREINIALHLQILYYELMPLLLGRENLLRDGVIQECSGFRDVYDDSLLPQLSLEFSYALRWIHLMQEGKFKLYDKDGYFTKHFPIVNGTLRPGWLATDDNLAQFTQSLFRQPCAANDYIVDPDMSETCLGTLQKMSDVTVSDHAKASLFEFQSYIRYREYCCGKKITCFEDLEDVIEKDRIELLEELYERVEDIELMAGIWAEKLMEGAHVPETFYCLIVEHLLHNLRSDRHWYERETRPNAFTYEQLQEIRKASVGRLICKTGDSVTEIQPQPFLRPRLGNEIDDCEKTTKNIDMSVFKDPYCDAVENIEEA